MFWPTEFSECSEIMENHPIPQDITGFQFKLVGNMTVKQFIYLAAGVVLAWFIFFILPIFLIIKLPLALLFLGLGIGLAFVPVDGRPMDSMIINLIKALFAPTQYIYQKDSGGLTSQISNQPPTPLSPPPAPAVQTTPTASTSASTSNVAQANAAAASPSATSSGSSDSLQAGSGQAVDGASVASQAQTLLNPNQPPVQQQIVQAVPATPPKPQPTPAPVMQMPVQVPVQTQPSPSYGPVIELSQPSQRPVLSGNLDDLVNEKGGDEKEESSFAKASEDKEGEKVLEDEKKLEEEVSSLTKQLEEAKALENTETSLVSLSLAHRKTQELEKLLEETQKQKSSLEGEIVDLKAKLEGRKQENFAPGTVPALKQTQRVRNVPPGMEKSVGLPSAPQDPNLITGILKDPRGNPLPNIIVEVKDTEDNPVRAFKTNGLGQFASATSLSNGKYIVSFDDSSGQNKFDAVQIETTGAPIMPLEIISIDAREVLRRELFN